MIGKWPNCQLTLWGLQYWQYMAVTNHSIPVHPPTIPEVNRAITRLRLHRAPGMCGISAELLRAVTHVICKAWETGCAPDDWKRHIILPFYKGKGPRTDCRNYRGITLLSVPVKVYAHVLLFRVKGHLQQLRWMEQSGFTPHRSTVDRITTLNMILQTRREYRRPLFVQLVVKLSCTTGLTTGCIHDTAGCQTSCQTGLTTSWMYVYTMQPVVNPVWQPVLQQIVSCKRGLSEKAVCKQIL